MRIGTMVNIILRQRDSNPPVFVRVPGIVVGEPTPSSYVNRNTNAVVQSSTVEVISRRDTRETQPNGRLWFQMTTEPVNLLARRIESVVGLDVHENGQRLIAAELFGKVEESIVEFKTRQAANQPASTPPVEFGSEEPITDAFSSPEAAYGLSAEELALIKSHRDSKAAATAAADQAAKQPATAKAKATADQTELATA